MFSYLSPEQRVPSDHPLRAVRQMSDAILTQLSQLFANMYSPIGRRSIPPEKLLRALLLQVLYTVRSERMLMEQLEYNLLFRWFVGLNMDEAVWDVTVFTKNRERLLKADIAKRFFELVLTQAQSLDLTSDEHFTVDGTLLEACAGLKSFKRVGDASEPPDEQKTMTLDADEFIRRFLLHVLPNGFQRIRYYGFLSNCHRARKLKRCRELLRMAPVGPAADPPADYRDRFEALTGQ